MGEETTCVQYLDQASSETCMVIGFGVPPLRGHLKSPPHSGDSRITGASPIVGSVASILQAVQSGTPGLGRLCPSRIRPTIYLYVVLL